MMRSMGVNTLAILLRVPEDAVVEALQKPGVLAKTLGIASADVLVVRAGDRRVHLSAEGVFLREETLPPQPKHESVVRVVEITAAFQRLLEVLRGNTAAQERFRAEFPESAGFLEAFLTNSGCGICRGRVSELLRTDCARSKAFLEYLEGVAHA